jgi:hypothetical protein
MSRARQVSFTPSLSGKLGRYLVYDFYFNDTALQTTRSDEHDTMHEPDMDSENDSSRGDDWFVHMYYKTVT